MAQDRISLTLDNPLREGERVNLCSNSSLAPIGCIQFSGDISSCRVGERLIGDGCDFQILSITWLPGDDASASVPCYLVEAGKDIDVGEFQCVREKTGSTLAWITLSDKGAAGKRVDESGPLIGKLVGKALDLSLIQGLIIPDDMQQLKGLLADLALVQGFDYVFTTGGTGVGPRDVTPEATLAVIEKRLPGFEQVMTSASLKKTPHAAISRAVAGTLGTTLIVNMPGSPKAVAECLEPLLPTLRHSLEKLQGDPSDCAVLRK